MVFFFLLLLFARFGDHLWFQNLWFVPSCEAPKKTSPRSVDLCLGEITVGFMGWASLQGRAA